MTQDLLLRTLLSSFGIKGVTERSIKVGTTGIIDNRFVIGVSANIIQSHAMQDILGQLNAPDEAQRQIRERLPNASTVGFGHEGNWEQGCRRVYLEYWGRLQEDHLDTEAVEGKEGNESDAEWSDRRKAHKHVMDAWKWQTQDCSQWHTSRYSVFTRLSNRECCEVFTCLVERTFKDAVLINGLSSLLRSIEDGRSPAKYTQLWSTIDVDQRGKTLGRQTLDLNILDYEIPAKQLSKIMMALPSLLPVKLEQMNKYLEQWCPKDEIVSHIAAGIDQAGGKYFCFYTI